MTAVRSSSARPRRPGSADRARLDGPVLPRHHRRPLSRRGRPGRHGPFLQRRGRRPGPPRLARRGDVRARRHGTDRKRRSDRPVHLRIMAPAGGAARVPRGEQGRPRPPAQGPAARDERRPDRAVHHGPAARRGCVPGDGRGGGPGGRPVAPRPWQPASSSSPGSTANAEDPSTIQFACGASHDALVGLLLPRAINVRATLRETEEAAGRGLLLAPSQQDAAAQRHDHGGTDADRPDDQPRARPGGPAGRARRPDADRQPDVRGHRRADGLRRRPVPGREPRPGADGAPGRDRATPSSASTRSCRSSRSSRSRRRSAARCSGSRRTTGPPSGCASRSIETPEDIEIPDDLLDHPDTLCVIEAIKILRAALRRRGRDHRQDDGPVVARLSHLRGRAVPPALAGRSRGDQAWSSTGSRRSTIAFGLAQIEAGADALTLPDHATGDLVSGEYYHRYLQDLHIEFVEKLPVPIILHICGKTTDRMGYIAETGDRRVPLRLEERPGRIRGHRR